MVSKRRFRRRSGGFTLIEILVVVSIIILLLGIGFVGGARFIAEAKKKQVQSMMQGLIGANEEFKAQRQQGNLNHGGNHPIKWSNVSGNFSSSERYVYACKQIKAVEAQLLAAVKSGENKVREPYADKDNDGTEELYDAWGTQIIYRSFNDGTNTTPNPDTGVNNSDLPQSRSPFFVSAGPDKQFGTDDDITSILD